MRARIAACAAAFAALTVFQGFLAPAASAQGYPDKPIRIIVPIGPGGSYDIVGRTVADQLGKRIGQSVVVENKPGAGTVVGTQFVASQPADGYTLLVGGLSNIVFNQSLYSKLGHDPMKEFTPITLVLGIPYVLVGRKDLPYATLAEVLDAARKEPGKFSMANAGAGTGQHLVAAALMNATGAKFLEVPYKGAQAAYPDILSGRVDFFIDSYPAALPHIKAGNVRAIAIAGPKRNPQTPEVPTMAEAGVKGFDIDSWMGIFAPARTPPDVIAKLRSEIRAILPALKEPYDKVGGVVLDVSDAEVGPFIQREYEMWTKVIRDTGIKLD
jgi:tripartite-type tricarboxylate transporter receptor subunit TctC